MIADLACLTYQTILLMKEWPSTPDTEADKSYKKQKTMDDMTALTAKYKSLKSKIKYMHSDQQSYCSCDGRGYGDSQ
eukprot:1863043-Ditylum_brightwellii.AAC.1